MKPPRRSRDLFAIYRAGTILREIEPISFIKDSLTRFRLCKLHFIHVRELNK